MKKEKRKELRALVRTMYDYQDMRLRVAGRLRLNSEDVPIDETFMDDAEINLKDYQTLEFVKKSTSQVEKKLKKEIERIVESESIYNEFFVNVAGCGPLMSAVCLSEFDIEMATTVSKMWQFAGLNSGLIKGKKIIKITKKIDMSQIIRQYENKKGEKCGIILTNELIRGDKQVAGFISPYNAWLRTKLSGVLASNMIKAQNAKGKSYAIDFYYPYKKRLENSEKEVLHLGKMMPWKNVSKGHRDNASKRYMIKMFLQDLYVAWRSMEGLSVREPYQEEYLGHQHK